MFAILNWFNLAWSNFLLELIVGFGFLGGNFPILYSLGIFGFSFFHLLKIKSFCGFLT